MAHENSHESPILSPSCTIVLSQEKAQLAQAQTDEERDYHNKRIRAVERMLQARVQANQRAQQTARTRKAAARWQRMSGPR